MFWNINLDVTLIPLLFVLVCFFVVFFLSEATITSFTGLFIRKDILLGAVVFALFMFLLKVNGLEFLLTFTLTVFLGVYMFLGMSLKRKHLYFLTFSFFMLIPVFLVLNMSHVSNGISVIVFMLLVLILLKGLFYEKLYS
jgi:hypothetical protein